MERLMANPIPLPCGLVVKKCRKDLIHFLRWQPHARITDRELELAILQLLLHRKLSARVFHGFDGVKHEVAQSAPEKVKVPGFAHLALCAAILLPGGW